MTIKEAMVYTRVLLQFLEKHGLASQKIFSIFVSADRARVTLDVSYEAILAEVNLAELQV